jgi:hypothetical protein
MLPALRALPFLVLLAACARPGVVPADAAAAALSAPDFVTVAAESECARLRAGAELGELDRFRDGALRARGSSRAAYEQAARLHAGEAETRAAIEAQIAPCRAETAWTAKTTDAGMLWEKLPP